MWVYHCFHNIPQSWKWISNGTLWYNMIWGFIFEFSTLIFHGHWNCAETLLWVSERWGKMGDWSTPDISTEFNMSYQSHQPCNCSSASKYTLEKINKWITCIKKNWQHIWKLCITLKTITSPLAVGHSHYYVYVGLYIVPWVHDHICF